MVAAIDISHLVFIDLIRNIIENTGTKVAKGNLMRIALNTGSQLKGKDFPTFADFVQAIEADENPLSRLDGRAVHLGDGLFGLRKCPFCLLATNYNDYYSIGLDGFEQLTDEFNAVSKIAAEHKVGLGAGVGPFCIFHQPMRSRAGGNLTIGGQPIEIFQLACRSASGKMGYADTLISEFGCAKAEVEKAMKEYMCCYGIRMKNGSAVC